MKYLNHIKNKIFLREGHLILVASLADKLVNLVIMIIAARYISLATYGHFSYIKSLVTTIMPFSGLGGNHSLLRFGMDTNRIKEKYNLLFSALVFGTLFNLIFLFIIYVFLPHYSFFNNNNELEEIFNVYIFFILTYYIYDVVRNFYRINFDNRTYAVKSIKYSFSILIVGSLSLIFFDYMIFIIVIVLLPVLTTFIDNRKILFKKISSIKFDKLFWKYGVLTGVGAFLNQFFMQSDILILGFLNIEPEQIARYKVATLLVYTVMFIPSAFLVRDFTTLSAHAKDKRFLIHYAYKYFKYSSTVLIVFIPLFYISSNSILEFLFGEKFQNDLNIQNILVFALIAIVILRMPFGNLLSAVGKVNLNIVNAVFTIIIAIPILFFLTKAYGIIGTAYAMLIIFFCSGIISLGMFIYYIKNIRG